MGSSVCFALFHRDRTRLPAVASVDELSIVTCVVGEPSGFRHLKSPRSRYDDVRTFSLSKCVEEVMRHKSSQFFAQKTNRTNNLGS